MSDISLSSHLDTHRVFQGWAAANSAMATAYALNLATVEDVEYFISQSEKFVDELSVHGDDYIWDGVEDVETQRNCEAEMARVVTETVAGIREFLSDEVIMPSDEVFEAEFEALLAELMSQGEPAEPEDDDYL